MKLVYCHCSLYNPGGMERVLLNKVRWICAHTDWEVLIVTTDLNCSIKMLIITGKLMSHICLYV